MRRLITGTLLLLTCLTLSAQRFFNLTADEVRIDSVLPVFNYTYPIGSRYADSVFTVRILYPEFIDMSAPDVERYEQLMLGQKPGTLPEIHQVTAVSRKEGSLHVAFIPVVWRDGRYQKLVSFMLDIKGKKQPIRTRRSTITTSSRYVSNSVLASGTWAKIRVPSSGIYELTSDVVRQAGFSDINKVKIFGYGGALQPELLTGDYIAATDDLQELPTCAVDGRRLFYAVGPVSWNSNHLRVRNPYSNYGYYFLTEGGEAPQTISWEDFLATYYPLEEHYCSLYEVDNYAWYHGGRNLYDSKILTTNSANSYTVSSTGTSSQGTVTVALTAETSNSGGLVEVRVNDVLVGSISTSKHGSYDAMIPSSKTFSVSNLQASNQITLTPNTNSGTVRLDYISTYANAPVEAPDVSQAFPSPEYLYHITNQNHHADGAADMVIILPTSQKTRAQAERLKTLHEQKDGLRVTIVPADELFNEFSSGTPDANAYRRYLKMLYDRAETEADMPRYLLLFGDCAWDNRMVTSEWSGKSPDDFLLCYESENSYSHTSCYVSDDYFCLLDDGEGGAILTSDQTDAAVGRITARDTGDATIAVDKIESYINNQEAGFWQNTICVMGDDGNENAHMQDADAVASLIEKYYPAMVAKRIMWDAYNRVTSSTGNSYPDVERLIKQQMQQGTLIMDYSGHGRADAISHEYVLRLTDFQQATSMRLPLWVTASCDIMPFDGAEDNIGETALFNKKGGAIAFYGTTRTVYQPQNRLMNLSFMRHVLSKDEEGLPLPIGEAARQTKNELITTGVVTGYSSSGNTYTTDRSPNRMQYSLLGDPALRLAVPTKGVKIEAVNNVALTDETMVTLKAGETAKVKGHIVGLDGTMDSNFNGTVTAVIRDVKEKVTCRLNDTGEASTPFVYEDRINTIYSGSNQVTDGVFTISFAVPRDIKYSDLDAQMTFYAVNNDKTEEAHGVNNHLVLNGTSEHTGSMQGPDIYCYLNSETFTNGDEVNTTPYFVAHLNDEDGINASGGGIGHDLLLVIDGDATKMYTLNNYFQYDFGSYTKGQVGFSIPALSYGQHKLQFRAWDVLNNSSISELTFNVVKGLEPLFYDVECTPNPAKTQTSFRIIHDRSGSELEVRLDVFDTSGRHLWTYGESGVPANNTYTVDWDLTVNSGSRLRTGLYLYRLSISCDGSTYATKAKKLIVLTQ